ncbi:thioredoxin-dependent thiol peroxidase [Emticicia fluvialis]|uniref:thioredoxin-dependent thiol peroxidase n=1 Tax=Emticicia fluvialis TaxID=2974474 RepID=UPI0021657358|nr:thioredoxin-dependent thiol peroxidase [Emticicia fluvialis]
MHLQKGSPAPELSAKNQNGVEVSLSHYIGRKVVLYFYPKDNTPTCTAEACNLRDNYQALLAQGYVVLGISADKQKTHQNFIKKYDLPFDLLTDTDNEIAKAFGVWGEKQLYGRKYMGVFRTTFIIDANGIIEEIIEKVESKNHAQQILK